MFDFKKLISTQLRAVADKIDAGSCDMTEDEAMQVLSILSHEALSKEKASEYLGMSRASFDKHIDLGDIPRGRKRVGFKELVWYKDELDEVIIKGRKKRR